jgi:hypothetical protein
MSLTGTTSDVSALSSSLLDEIDALGKWYLAEVPRNTRVWLRTPRIEPPGPGLLGRPRTQPRVAKCAPRARELRREVDELYALGEQLEQNDLRPTRLAGTTLDWPARAA